MKCARKPRMSSITTFDVVVCRPNASEMEHANLFSFTPRTTFPFFLTMGIFSLKKFDSY
jgi:hypothetical protein